MIDYYEIKSQPITRAMVWAAYKEVRSSQVSSGVDAMTWQWLEKHKSRTLYTLWNRLTSGSYFPQAVKEVSILHIPAILTPYSGILTPSD